MAVEVSSRWERMIRRGFHPITRVDVAFPGEGVVYHDLPVSGGSYSMTRKSAVRTSGTIDVPDPTLFPALHDDSPIAPYGAELIIRTGMIYPEGADFVNFDSRELEARGLAELVDIGHFIIGEASGSEKAGNITTIDFYDRGRAIERMDYVTPKNFGGKLTWQALEEVITDPDPWIDGQMSWDVIIDDTLDNLTLPSGTLFDSDRWAFIEKLAEGIGAEVFFGRDGNAYVIPVPGVHPEFAKVDADWVLDTGDHGVLVDVSRKVSREEVYNGVVVVGSADGERSPPHAFVFDFDNNSRTHFGGPFGKSIKRVDNSNLTTIAACEKAAKAELKNITGLQRSVDIQTFGNPAIDPGDIILVQTRVRVTDTEFINYEEIHMVDGVSYDFASASQSLSTRSIQYVEEA